MRTKKTPTTSVRTRARDAYAVLQAMTSYTYRLAGSRAAAGYSGPIPETAGAQRLDELATQTQAVLPWYVWSYAALDLFAWADELTGGRRFDEYITAMTRQYIRDAWNADEAGTP